MAPLTGHRVVELAGLGPAPFAGMMLADMGAEVIRIDRVGGKAALGVSTPLDRGRLSVAIDVRTERGLAVLMRLVGTADVLIEPFRPGVAERLGFGPDVALAANPRLVYGRMTGWGQTGPLAHTAGHDINYIALAGVLGAVGRRDEAPVPPLNLIGDFGGGGMLLTCGVLAALLERAGTGRGQVVDAAMVDGSALLMAMIYGMRAAGTWSDERGTNVLDGGAPFYDTYRTADGGWMAVGAIEPQFFKALAAGLGMGDAELPRQYDRKRWPEMRARFAEAFAGRTRDQWTAHFEGTDACVTPVLSMAEAATHPHNVERGTFRLVDGVSQPAPAPRFSEGDGPTSWAPELGADTRKVLAAAGYADADLDALRAEGVIS
jgi:alpha-methylacyl-CoA racemase